MAPDYSEVLDLWAEQAKHAAASPEAIHALLRESQRGAVVLDELLDSPAWNIFRSNLAGQVQGYDIERTQLRGQVEAGTLVGDERARADLRLQYLRGLLEAFQIALDLPKTLIGKHATLEKVVQGNAAAKEGDAHLPLPDVLPTAQVRRVPGKLSTAAPAVRSATGAARQKISRKRKRR